MWVFHICPSLWCSNFFLFLIRWFLLLLFYYERVLNFAKHFLHLLMIMCFSPFILSMWFVYVDPSLHLRDEFHLVMMYDPFHVLITWFACGIIPFHLKSLLLPFLQCQSVGDKFPQVLFVWKSFLLPSSWRIFIDIEFCVNVEFPLFLYLKCISVIFWLLLFVLSYQPSLTIISIRNMSFIIWILSRISLPFQFSAVWL